MNRRLTASEFNGCYVEGYVGDKESSDTILLLHGYPADKGNKNLDMAEHLSRKFNLDSYVIHYKGLGKSPGQFSFSRSISDSNSFYEYLSKKYGRVHLLGHSWGGLVAMNIFVKAKNKPAMVLLSPFSTFPQGESLTSLVSDIHVSTTYLAHQPLSDLLQEIQGIAVASNSVLVRELDGEESRLTVIQAIHDDEVPVEVNREFARKFRKAKVKYIEVDSDHSFFNNRSHVLELVESAFKENI